MIKYIQALLLIFIMQPLMAQNVLPNAGFENWVNAGGLFNSYQNPANWGTLNDATSFLGIITVTKATQAQFVKSGNAALRLETYYINLLNRPAQGLCVTGSVNTQTEQVEGGLPYNLRPASFSGWYQYYPVGVDTGSVVAVFTKWNAQTLQRDTVGIAGQWFTEQATQYNNFNVAVEYSSEEAPDTVMVILVSSSQTEPGIGSVMYIDDLNFEFTAATEDLTALPRISVYPNPAIDFISFDAPQAATMQIRNLGGVLVKTFGLFKENRVTVDDLPAGIYFSLFLDAAGQPVATSKWVLIK
jgi:hypothetical protein